MPAPKPDIYLLSSRDLAPETIAVAFAKTSRLPDSFRDIAAELTEANSAEFHEKWVVGYGHASVAEHAVLHLAIENVSRLAMEAIESNRLASYTEKSTRYQKWDADAFHLPAELQNSPLLAEYLSTCRLLFATYNAALEPLKRVIASRVARREGENEEAWDRRVRSQYVDVARFLLPASSLANVGMTANARVLENSIRKWRSHPLTEVRAIGAAVKQAAQAETPTLVKYAEPVEYLIQTAIALEDQASAIPPLAETDFCRLVSFDEQGEQRILAAALYRFGALPYTQALHVIQNSTPEELKGLAEKLLGAMDKHDVPLRELEHCAYTFDLLMDQGAYAEFKRHRMMTQTPQALSAALGFATPALIKEAGFTEEYQQAMQSAARTWEKLYAFNPQVAQYIVPNGFYRRVLATFNLREAYAFCQLRSTPGAHFSIRLIAQRIHADISKVHPLLSGYMRMGAENWQGINEEYFV